MSRPCRTCRARKKACDKSRPHCQACKLSGRKCPGYDTERSKVFINLDSSNLKTPIKPLISQAIFANKRNDLAAQNVYSKTRALVSSLSLNTLDLSVGEFRDHFVTLWGSFHSLYARTADVWSSGISSAGLHTRALDLALIALATMRLSFSPEVTERKYKVFSLTAYNDSVRMFRRLLQDTSRAEKSKPALVIISLVFTLFEAVQQRPTQIYESGWAGHLKGALALMQRQGPGEFQTGALHEAFRKLREMAILYLLSTKQRTFLSTSEWMTVPWKKIKKTHRDLLYDIAAKITSFYPLVSQDPRHLEPDVIWRCQQLHTNLLHWRINWLRSEHPEILTTSHQLSQLESRFPKEEKWAYFPDPKTFPTNDFSYLVAEWSALVLLLNSIVSRLLLSTVSDPLEREDSHLFPDPMFIASTSILTSRLTSTTPSTSTSTSFEPPVSLPVSPKIHHLRTYLHSALQLPCFGYSPSTPDEAGITEGRCRSLLPNWILSNVSLYSGESAVDESPGQSDDGDASWWAGLSARLNYGVF